MFGRGNELPQVENGERLTRRRLFSICGQLVGHYPVGSWLRVACSFVKRESDGGKWEDWIGERAQRMIREVLKRVRDDDPVRGIWAVGIRSDGRVWCDASSLALGAVLEIGDKVVEDMAWLRKPTDATHINVAELDAVIRGINMAVKWGLKVVEVMTDSATVLSWLNSVIVEDRRVKVTGMSEMLVRRRLAVVEETVREYGLTLSASYVQSLHNKADALTRVPKVWLQRDRPGVCGVSIVDLHAQHHFGVDRTLQLARLVDSDVSREDVEQCVKACSQCWSIDPAPVTHGQGRLEVERNWSRLAIDVTHFGRGAYLTMVDCGPSRFAIWRQIGSENGGEIGSQLEEIFRERGPPDELLMDNSTAFRSRIVEEVCSRWNVQRRYRAAYRPSGNGIVERHHRTIKARAARTGADPRQIVFWYNLAAKKGTKNESAPCAEVFCYDWRHPLVARSVERDEEPCCSGYSVGDQVWVKPPAGTCTSKWALGQVTGVTSSNNISVNGIPRHILDVRRFSDDDDEVEVATPEEDRDPEALCGVRDLFEELDELPNAVAEDSERGEEEGEALVLERRPVRNVRPPSWLEEYEW